MKKALALLLALCGLGILAFGDTCAPCATPATEPLCYTAFWQGEDICFELVVPWGFFCCCCCTTSTQVLGWRVTTLEGNVVYQETFPSPVAPSKWVWKQVYANGNPVEPGYYKIIVSTTTGDYESTVKIVAKPECQPCCFPFFFFGCWGLASKPCLASWCTPYVKVYRCPTCEASCCGPCGVTIYLGVKDP